MTEQSRQEMEISLPQLLTLGRGVGREEAAMTEQCKLWENIHAADEGVWISCPWTKINLEYLLLLRGIGRLLEGDTGETSDKYIQPNSTLMGEM